MQAISPQQFHILDVRVDNVRLDDAVSQIVLHAGATSASPCQMAFVNAHCLNLACADSTYRDILLRARRVFADGIGVRLAARAHGVEVVENVNGTDLFPPLCASLAGSGIGLYLLGARPDVIDGVTRWIGREYPGLDLRGAEHGYFSDSESHSVARRIRASGAQLLLVAMGVPRQEKWIEQNLHRCGVNVALGVGALFDFYSATVPRAPLWMRQRGLEWMYRLYREPARMWRRYVMGNPHFLLRVARQRLVGARTGSTVAGG